MAAACAKHAQQFPSVGKPEAAAMADVFKSAAMLAGSFRRVAPSLEIERVLNEMAELLESAGTDDRRQDETQL